MSSAQEASAAELHLALLGRNERVGCAESLTGGELASWLSSTPGASATFTGAVVSYANEVKRDVLGVTAEKVVSPDCAEQMATGVRQLLGVDWALSTTGVAGPDEQEGQAVGTVYVGIASTQRVRSVRLALEGDRAEIRRAVCAAALQLLLQEVTGG
jgi:nicotinamide-nucleotide amidase